MKPAAVALLKEVLTETVEKILNESGKRMTPHDEYTSIILMGYVIRNNRFPDYEMMVKAARAIATEAVRQKMEGLNEV
jgi:hypothetical protein